MRIVLALVAGAVALVAPAAQGQRLDLTQQYNVLASGDAERLEADLNKAGENGFRLVAGSTTGGSEITVLVEKVSGSANYQYAVLAASNTQRLEQRLSLAASQGFRLAPGTMTSKSRRIGSDEIVMVMEKGPGQGGNWQYVLLDAAFGSSLQATLSGVVNQGYGILGMVRKGSQVLLVLGKPAE